MMQTPSLLEIKSLLEDADWSNLPVVRIAVLRNITIDTLEPFMRYEGLEADIHAQLAFGDFDHIVQDATLAGGPVTDETDVVQVFPHFPSLSPDLAWSFNSLPASDIELEIKRINEFIPRVLDSLRDKTQATILWHSFESPLDPAYGVLDDQMSDGQTACIERLNQNLRDLLHRYSGVYLVNLDRCRARIGAERWQDARLWHAARCPYSLAALQEIARENFKFIRSLKGRNRKCLVLDCDNTLWGGIVGEDGLSGIQLGPSFPGSTYTDFQKEVLKLHRRGVLLALCSKNNPEDVWEVFDKHPDMLIKREHLSGSRINWSDKPDNLRDIAAELNIGLDSLVLVDDSEFEVDLVRRTLPEIKVLHLPPARAAEAAGRLAACGWFDTVTQVAEDRNRSAMYKAEKQRETLRTKTGDMTEYLRSLDMVVQIARPDDLTIPRVAQLTQKTNQFNLTTRRYTEEHIRRFLQRPDADVLHLRLSDRFGDSGIVGVCILIHEDHDVVVDTFLMSCRILGRTVEQVFLTECLRVACRRGAARAIGQYIPTRKNHQTAEFYPRFGFLPLSAGDDASNRMFALDLTAPLPATPDYFKDIQLHADIKEPT